MSGPERKPAGIVWMDLCRKHADAIGADDEARRRRLAALMRDLEAEYPEAVQLETALWG